MLYIHGYNDYFFQQHVADFYAELEISFYALDLRKYGRSLMSHQTPGLCRSLRDFYQEIDAAVEIIKRDGHELILVSGHSTGGLIASLWAEEGDNRESVCALILNSPFLGSGVPVPARLIVDRACRPIARRRPGAAFPIRLSSRYSRSLHDSYQGEWVFDTSWKSTDGTLLRLDWLTSIHEGQRLVRKGIGIKIPVLVLCAAASGGLRAYRSDPLAADIILNAEKMARLSARLGQNVTCIRIPGAVHDVFLSPLAARTEAFDQLPAGLRYTPRRLVP